MVLLLPLVLPCTGCALRKPPDELDEEWPEPDVDVPTAEVDADVASSTATAPVATVAATRTVAVSILARLSAVGREFVMSGPFVKGASLVGVPVRSLCGTDGSHDHLLTSSGWRAAPAVHLTARRSGVWQVRVSSVPAWSSPGSSRPSWS
ncbi:hypothetical protein PD653_3733 [Nocardioides sp. PD653]|nr:hypothetical protein PD653_3733 [Nocardioides sp. PD653]